MTPKEIEIKLRHLIIDLEEIIAERPSGDNVGCLQIALIALKEVTIYNI